MTKKHEKNTIDIENSKKLYYNTTEIMKKVLKIINSTRGALNERLRVRYSLDPFNLLDNASVGSVENIPEYIAFADGRCFFCASEADDSICLTENLKSEKHKIRRKIK